MDRHTAGRNLEQGLHGCKRAALLLLLATLALPATASAETDTSRTATVLLGGAAGAFTGGGATLLIYRPFSDADVPFQYRPNLAYCLTHTAGITGGFLLGAGIGLLVEPGAVTQIVELAVLVVAMVADFWILSQARENKERTPIDPREPRPPEDEIVPGSVRARTAPTLLRLSLTF